jgi:hypothetical protein
MEKRFDGEIVGWNQTKFFGFIAYGHNGRHKRIYFSTQTICPDWKGSHSWAFSEGIPVTFAIEERKNTKTEQFNETAVDVAPIFPMSEPEDVRGYRETSVVRQKRFDVVFLTRPCGDMLFCHRNDVVNDVDRWDLLTNGSPVWHGVRYDEDRQRWRASEIELYSADELYQFQHEDDPKVEPEPQVVLEAEPVSEILAAENKNKTLFELVLAKRGKSS